LLIYVIIKSRPKKLVLHAEYIALARHPARLSGEAAYFYTHLRSAITFILSITAASLTIDRAEFDRCIEFSKERIALEKERMAVIAAEAAAEAAKAGGPVPGQTPGALSGPTTLPLSNSKAASPSLSPVQPPPPPSGASEAKKAKPDAAEKARPPAKSEPVVS
jgi:hypothetical protein